MKVFISGLITETNTFSPLPTGLENYQETALFHGDASQFDCRWASGILRAWRTMAEAGNMEVKESLFAMAQPAGRTVRPVYAQFLDEILSDLKTASPVDMVLLSLHGAMVSEGCDDCEGDIIEKVRACVGADVPIGIELDLHCHITEQMIDNATAVITYKEYPHTDMVERAAELFDICASTLKGEIEPKISVHDCHMVGIWPTTTKLMNNFVTHMKALENREGILSVSFAHGFPWADVVDVGAKMLVVTDNDIELGNKIAKELAQDLWSMRDTAGLTAVDINEALDCVKRDVAGPIVLADIADNPGGGAAGDSTYVLKAILERRLTKVAIAPIWDPLAVRICMEAGAGSSFDLRVGGKCGPTSGEPLDLTVTVKSIQKDAVQSLKGQKVKMGDAVHVHACGIDLVLNTIRTQTLGLDAFTQFGMELSAYKLIVVKSMHHFFAAFNNIAKEIIYVSTPGALTLDFANIPYTKLNRQYWPRDENPR